MKVEVLSPHGFCAGVKAALEKARALSDNSEQVYCLHEIVHNELVVASLEEKGFIFVENINDVPSGAKVLFSAHGVSPSVREDALNRNLKVIDATCPFVTRAHRFAASFYASGLGVIIVGKGNHAEVKGILGEAPGAVVVSSIQEARDLDTSYFCAGRKVGVVSQTTMNADDVRSIVEVLRTKVDVESVAEVCNATKERQDAVKAFAGDALLVLGSANSSNTRRLCEVTRCRTFRAGNMHAVKALDFSGVQHLGLTSGASTPEEFFNEAYAWLQSDLVER